MVNKGNWLNVVGNLVNDLQADKVPHYVDLPLHYLTKSDLKKLGTLIRYIPYLFPDPQNPAVLIGLDPNDDAAMQQLIRDHTIMYKADLSSGQPSSLEMQGAIRIDSHLGMSRLQCLAIIVAAVFRIDLLPDAQGQLLNFNGLYRIPKGKLHPKGVTNRKEKAKCFVNYISRGLNFDSQEATETVEFSQRSNIDISMNYLQQQANSPLGAVAFQTTLIEDNEGGLHHDFANMHYGGGVLGSGCVQEESYVAQHPESLIPRRLYPVMDDTTTIISKGHRQYSQVPHFNKQFQFLQGQQDSFQKPRILVATDAKSFAKNQTDYTQVQPVNTPLLTQFDMPLIRREIHKLVSGFGANVVEDTDAVAHTGKYGCGAFGGNEAMKFLIQWLAMSVCQVDMTYCKQQTDAPELDQIYSLLQGKTVDYLWTLLRSLAQHPFRQTLAQKPPAGWNSEVLQFVAHHVANN
ncbi:MAG: hypothetical protein KVP17_002653 [Porospora cf. gigantea B]|uniref:uncharacterized protein n=1 Tax=Porospora cf. gigantea B TaxID=2853592 RepID=UPI003571EA4A|nr:MAG: hypothetical protein KVP17_002653 [Porospora cf. gigantea B]